MNSTSNNLATAFAKNRTEELSSDVWNHFVMPLFFEDLDILSARKPRLIIGGRGCGKTMLLRYFSHETQFSPSREHTPAETLQNIGLYWRIDTQFANAMKSRGVEDSQWQAAFEHFISLYTALSIFEALDSISKSRCASIQAESFDSLSFKHSSAFDANISGSRRSVSEYLERCLAQFEMWVSNVKKVPEPLFYPGVSFIHALIRDIQETIPALQNTVFHVFLDEFENLLEYQQRTINTRIKHSEAPLIFSVAMKRRGFATRQTLGDESITEIADFRSHDLEANLLERDFTIFAAEVLCLHLSFAEISRLPINPSFLRDTKNIEERSSNTYRKLVETYARSLFPAPTSKEMARDVLADSTLFRKLTNNFEKALKHKGSNITASHFIDTDFPQETITCLALLSRASPTPEALLSEFNLHKVGKSSKFEDWVHNNFIGCLLWLYDSNKDVCPIYAGFDSFVKMAKGNLRHFLELCHKSLAGISISSTGETPTVSPAKQSKAARQTSVAFLREIRSFGVSGNNLHGLVLRLGSFFALAQRRSSQSEPEQNHFSIKRGDSKLSDEEESLLKQAVRWSVLFEEEETKLKEPSDSHQSNYEYLLNPIYAPYFNISYRKKRKLELSPEEFHILATGSYDDVHGLLQYYSKRWSIDLSDASPTLFSHMNID